jgi:membrane associated rhomboid family serine protease
LLPLKDNIPTDRFPVVTVGLVLINLLVFLYEATLAPGQLGRFYADYGFIPYEITHGIEIYSRGGLPVYATMFTAMFVHAGWLHFGGNMLFLWIFGNNVEDSMGRVRFVVFYLMCGLLATIAQIAIGPDSIYPNIGASGAIAGVLGGYLLLYPRARVLTLIFPIFVIRLPAVVVLMYWILIQVFSGTLSLTEGSASGGVAYFAHIGGFVVGLLTIKLFTFDKGVVHIKRRQCRQ